MAKWNKEKDILGERYLSPFLSYFSGMGLSNQFL